MLDYFFLIFGLLLLYLGGQALVKESLMIASKLKMSKVLIGVVLVGFGTSVPELLISVQAALAAKTDLVVGNVVGSNIANSLLILGVAGFISPFLVKDKAVLKDSLAVIAASLVLMAGVYTKVFSQLAGVFMVLSLCVYLFLVIRLDRRQQLNIDENVLSSKTLDSKMPKKFSFYFQLLLHFLVSILGVVFLILGSDLVVDSASAIAIKANISEVVIGLSLVALGTSLPELATVFVAALKKQSEVSVGNVLGSNLFNILGVLAIAAIVRPVPIFSRAANFDVPLVLALAVLIFLILFFIKKISRLLGGLFLIAYFLYIFFMYV